MEKRAYLNKWERRLHKVASIAYPEYARDINTCVYKYARDIIHANTTNT